MKRFLASALIIGVSTVALVGCEEKTKDQVVETNKGPGGTTQTKTTVEQTKTGDHKDDAPAVTPETPK